MRILHSAVNNMDHCKTHAFFKGVSYRISDLLRNLMASFAIAMLAPKKLNDYIYFSASNAFSASP